ncbi:uncharacterized protein PV07_10529 [Cladophialophora immunda]|uniref:Uncharacterized protein n=1 Tax=Cladophialophora immunda TaxID=569365 RepID=A0A0D2C2X5_9EURO|nr:uncharacterized protein PV07_10529 [Cladophialophora immunda]KIW24840.1 hypothetical protein PV07_10529 [Cladophialophora immunda]
MLPLLKMPPLCSRVVRNWAWVVFALMTLISLTSRSLVCATVVCAECRPLSLQEAPGVGLSLAPGYGYLPTYTGEIGKATLLICSSSVSIRFANGTFSDVALVKGTEAYLRAMKRWQYFVSDHPTAGGKHDSKMSNSSLERLRSWFQWGLPNPAGTLYESLDDSLIPIVEMMRKLYHEANQSVPLTNNNVFLAVPDLQYAMTYETSRHIEPLLQAAGLNGLFYLRQSQLSLLHLYNLDNCYDIWLDEVTWVPDEECEEYHDRNIQSVFSIHLDESSLTLRSMIRDDGLFPYEPGDVQYFWADEGVGQDKLAYWDWLEHSLRGFLHDRDVAYDLLLLSGTQATALDFQQIIQSVLKDHKKIVPRDYLRRPIDHTYAAARGAAQLARVYLCSSSCMSAPWCPTSKHCKKWARHRDDEGAKKIEL